MQGEYIPGVCNIGRAEIVRRNRAGKIGLAITIILLGLFLYLDTPRVWRIFIFIPSIIASIGFLQARMHFCAYYGIRGIFNLSSKAGKTDSVEQAEYRARDRRRSLQIIMYSAIIASMVTILAYFL